MDTATISNFSPRNVLLSKLLYLYVIFSPMQESFGVSVVNRGIRWHILDALIKDTAQRMYDDARFSEDVRLTGLSTF